MSRAGGAARRAASTARGAAGGTLHRLRRTARPDRWTQASPARLWHVDPRDVTHLTRERLAEDRRGRRTDGDWDLDAVPIDTLRLTRILTARFVAGRSWEDAGFVVGADLGEGVPGLGTRYVGIGADALARRAATLDALHASLARDGWLPHHATGSTFVREMALAVGRDGRLIRNSGGLHRLILARLVGLDAVPVRILTEHPLTRGVPTALRGRTG